MIRSKEQEALMVMLKKLAVFFEENKLNYYLLGGSAIGALRHKGFIPWDDDIDIIMDHDSYYKLIGLADQLPWEDIAMVCQETSDVWYRPFIQFYSKTDTCFLHSAMFNEGEAMGTLIDVMCLDDIPASRRLEYERSLLLYQETLNDVFTYNHRIREYEDEYVSTMKRKETMNKANLIAELKADVEKYAEDDCDECVVRFWGRKIRNYKKSWFDGVRYIDFEDMKLPVATKAEACLRLQYGYDWYRLPAKAEQVQHAFILNHEISANNYFEDTSNFVDWEEARKLMHNRKVGVVKSISRKFPVDQIRNKISIRRLFAQLNLKENQSYLDGLIKARNHREYNQIFAGVIKDIRLFEFLDNELKDEEVTAINQLVASLIYDGRYYDGEKVARFIFKDWTDQIDQVPQFDLLNRVLALVEAYQDKELDKLQLAIDSLSQEGSQIPDYILGLNLLRINGRGNLDGSAIGHMCDSYLEQKPGNYDLMKIKADIMSEAGDLQGAREIHEEVYYNSRNGLDVMELFDRYGFKDRYENIGSI